MLTVRLLGQFSLALDDKAVELPSRPAQSLLAWLVLHPGIDHRRERLAGIFWPDASEENARNNLRHALWRLRRAIPDEFVKSDNIAIRWVEGDGWSLDVDKLHAPPAQPAGADELIRSLESYGGELLPGFYDEWVALERERLIALYESQMACLLDALFVARRGQETIDWAEKWIAQGRTPEPAYRALMTAHASLGDRSAALTAYQRCVDALERELVVPPSAETVALADSIRNSQFTIHHFLPPFPSPLPPVTLSNLPAPTTPLIGRENELSQLADLLADPNHRLVTILGPGGMGKSRLALAASHTALENFPDGVFLVELTALTSADGVARAVGDALGYPFQNDPRPPRQQLLDYLRGRKLLLLLDNFEHLLEGAELLIALLEAAPGLHLLVTSRERLHLQAETLFRLDGLTYPADGQPPQKGDGYGATNYGATDLFLQSARRVRQAYTPGSDEWPAIIRICRLVGGIPLGIVLAAGWAEMLSPGEIADEIAANVAFLGQELGDLDPRHRTIEAVFAQSWQRLTGAEQQVLMGLSIFAGGFDRDAAKAVASATLPVLTRLVDKALLWRVGDGRYDLHELIRQLACRKLVGAGMENAVLGLHSRWFLGLVFHQEKRLKGSEQEQAIELMERERENVRTAWHWAAQNGESKSMQQAMESLGIFHNRPGRWEEGEALMGRAATALGESAHPQPKLLRAWLLAWRAVCLHRIGPTALAHESMAQAAAILEEPALAAEDLRPLRAFVHLQRNGDLMGSRRRDVMGVDLQRAVELFEEVGDLWWLTRAQLALGHLEFFNGQFQQAEQRFMTSRRMAQQIGDQTGLAQALDELSFVGEHAGRFSEAEELVRERYALKFKQTWNFVTFRSRLVWVSISLGRFADALQAASEIIAQAEGLGIGPEYRQFDLNDLARAHLHLGHFEKAYVLAASAAQLWANVHGREHPFMRRTVGMAMLGAGKHENAQQILSQVRADQQQMGNDNLLPLSGAFVDEAYPFLLLDEFAQTRHCLAAGLRLAQAIGAYRYTIQALPAVGVLLAAQERLAEAATIHGLIQRYPYLTNSRWYATVALDRLTELLAPLPPDVMTAAEERGRALGLPAMTAELLALLS